MIKDNRRFDRMFREAVNAEIYFLVLTVDIDYSIESTNNKFKISDKDYKKHNLTTKITQALIKHGRANKER
jgi:hypothetical protein